MLAEYKDVFAELPNELPPERTVFHTIPLKEGAEPPPRKSYRLSRPEMQEVDKQVKALLAKGYIRPSSSPYVCSSHLRTKGRWHTADVP